MKRALIAVLGAGALTASLVAGGATTASAHDRHKHKAPRTLQQAAALTGRDIGAAATQIHMDEAEYVATLDREFNQLTPENEMKWETTEPSRGQFNFAPADELVRHARQERMRVHGHVLVWHSHSRPGSTRSPTGTSCCR